MLQTMIPDRTTGTPLYLQLAEKLRELIADGLIDQGKAVPSERLLSESIGTSRVTVRKAIDELVSEGLLERRHGSGTYVAKRIEQSGDALTGFTAEATKRGEQASSVWFLRSIAFPTPDEAAILGVAITAPVARLGRVRLMGGEPLAIENAVLPQTFLPDIEAIGGSLYAALDRTNSRPVKGLQRLRAALASPTEAGLLSIPEGSAILRIERRTFLADGTAVELTRSAYRGDRYEFVTHLSDISGESDVGASSSRILGRATRGNKRIATRLSTAVKRKKPS